VITAFQLHFRPALCDGNPDRETVARLQALQEKYPGN
jgi:N-acetyl-anhydromuramyl-L-alanine amidase AmpD